MNRKEPSCVRFDQIVVVAMQLLLEPWSPLLSSSHQVAMPCHPAAFITTATLYSIGPEFHAPPSSCMVPSGP